MWIKQGRIFHREAKGDISAHAQVPTPFVMEDRIRIFYSCRNNDKSFITYFDLAKDLKTIIYSHKELIMEMGNPGHFDSDGLMPSCVIEESNEMRLYYIGWNALANTARYHNEIGVAVSHDNGKSFIRKFPGPIVGRSKDEPGLAVMPFVMYKNWYRMYYQSLVSWHKIGDQYEPVYVIKYTESVDGINWEKDKRQCVKSDSPLEAFSRPCVIFEDDVWKMWYCYRNSVDYRGGHGSYRIGYAESFDGVDFTRMDNRASIPVSEDGWDSEMIAYPYVFDFDGKRLMLYNGNGFGQTGIGLAVWDPQ